MLMLSSIYNFKQLQAVDVDGALKASSGLNTCKVNDTLGFVT